MSCRLGEAGRRVLGFDHCEAGAGQHRREVHRHGSCQERLLGLRQGRLRPGLANADLCHLLPGTFSDAFRKLQFSSEVVLTVHARPQNADKTPMKITVASGSLQPFTTDQWAMHQQDTIRKVTFISSRPTWCVFLRAMHMRLI